MNERAMQKMLGSTARRIANMLVRGSVVLSNASARMQTLQVNLLGGETADNLEHFEPYGFTSKPRTGAEVLAMFFDGDKSHGVVFMAADRRYRLISLQDGEVALHDDQGQKVHLTRTGIVIDGGGRDVAIKNAPTVHVPQDLVVARDIIAGRDVKDQGGGKSMAGMRSTYNGHNHGGSGPNQGM